MRTTFSDQRNKLVTMKKIEHYTYGMEDILGKGFSSHVYRGRDDFTGEPVAVKVIEMDMIQNGVYKDLLASEIYCLKLLRNTPHIIQLKDVYSTKNNSYVICELCESGTLSTLIAKRKFSEQQSVKFMEQLITGYLHLHRLGIIHRDIKPANIFVQRDKLKIADFGFATFCSEKKIQEKFNIGSPLYMPPESLMRNQYSFKSDIWSLGIVFYEMLFGKAPWRANTESQLLNKILETSIDKLIPKESLSSVSSELLKRILHPDPRVRMGPEELGQFSFNSFQSNPSGITVRSRNSGKDEEVLMSTGGTVSSNSGSDVLSITKQLLCQMHLCRFTFKLIKRIMESSISSKQTQGLITSLKSLLGLKLSQISQLEHTNSFNVPLLVEYRKTEDYFKLMKLAKTYRARYQSQLGRLGDTPNSTQNVITPLSQFIRNLSAGFSKITQQTVQHYQSHILLLDYLTTAYILMKLLSKNDLALFAQKSKIEEIVDGQTSSVGYQHFVAIRNKVSTLGLI